MKTELSMTLDELRAELSDLDGELLALVARRKTLSEQVAAVKRATGRATRDFAREREVILRGRTAAERLGLEAAGLRGDTDRRGGFAFVFSRFCSCGGRIESFWKTA